MSSQVRPRVVIIGGGITGLSAAWRLQQLAPATLELTILEASDRWGGKILTEEMVVEGRTLRAEAGAESFVTRKPQVWQLAHEIDLEEDILPAGNEARGTYLLHRGQLVPVPLSPWAFLKSPLMSPMGKMRLLAEPFIPAHNGSDDESLADFARRRLGHQAADNLVLPILAGIYNADPERQSLLTTSPIMREMEQQHGSLFIAALARSRSSKVETSERPRFITFQQGAEQLILRLVDSIDGKLQLHSAATELQATDSGYRVGTSRGELISAEAVLLAAPSNQAAPLVSGLAAEAAAGMRSIPHADIGTLLLAIPAEKARPISGITGLMVPRREDKLIDAVTWLSGRTPGLSAQGTEVLKVYFGGAAPHLLEYPAERVRELLLAELRDVLSLQGEPLETSLHRWPEGYPQAQVGHLNLVDQIEQELPPGIFTAGSSYRGLAVPDCIRQADRAAQQIIDYLKQAMPREEDQ